MIVGGKAAGGSSHRFSLPLLVIQLPATGHLGMSSSAVYQALRLRYSYKWNNQLPLTYPLPVSPAAGRGHVTPARATAIPRHSSTKRNPRNHPAADSRGPAAVAAARRRGRNTLTRQASALFIPQADPGAGRRNSAWNVTTPRGGRRPQQTREKYSADKRHLRKTPSFPPSVPYPSCHAVQHKKPSEYAGTRQRPLEEDDKRHGQQKVPPPAAATGQQSGRPPPMADTWMCCGCAMMLPRSDHRPQHAANRKTAAG